MGITYSKRRKKQKKQLKKRNVYSNASKRLGYNPRDGGTIFPRLASFGRKKSYLKK